MDANWRRHLASASVDIVRAIAKELTRRDPGFVLNSVEADVEKGTGTYQAVTTNGKQVTRTFIFEPRADGSIVLLTPEFEEPSNAVTTAARDPYAPTIAVMRAAAASTPSTPESRLAKHYAADLRRALAAEHAEIAAEAAAHPFPRMTAAELEPYRAPDPYQGRSKQ